jgi:hypothetical protein
MSRYTRVIVLLLPALLLVSAAVAGAAGTGLSSEVIASAFSTMKNEEGQPYQLEPGSIVFLPGSFTAPGKDEAVVYFVDSSQSHAAGPAELWLMTKDGAWKPAFMIDQSDEMTARLIDPAGSGISAVYLSASHFSTGGFISSYDSLVSLYGGSARTIFSADGNDFAFHEMYVQVGGKDRIGIHQISFRDGYGDSPAEMIDTELSGAFVHTGVGDSGYEVVWKPTSTTTYRLVTDANGVLTGVEKIK